MTFFDTLTYTPRVQNDVFMIKRVQYIATLATPIIISITINMVFSLVDTIYAGILGDYAINAISYFIPLQFIFIAVYVGLGAAANVYFSRSLGAKNMDDLRSYYAAVNYVLRFFAAGVFVVLLALWFGSEYLPLSKDVIVAFRTYSCVLVLSMLVFGLPSILFDSVLKAHKKMKQSMMAQVIGNIFNIGFNTLFLFVFHWGIFGIAFSTLISQAVAMGIVYFFAMKFDDFKYVLHSWAKPAKKYIRNILNLSLLSSTRDFLISLEMLAVTFFLTKIGENAVGAYGILFRYATFAMVPIIGMFIVMGTLFGHDIGAKDYKSVKKDLIAANIVSLGVIVLFFVPVYAIFGDVLVGWVTRSEDIQQYALSVFAYIPLQYMILSPFLIFHAFAQAMHSKKLLIMIPLLRYLVLSVPILIGCQYLWGFIGVVIVAPIIGNLITVIVYSIEYHFMMKKLIHSEEKGVAQ